jgi:cbb3-type cytochrome oxidase subunit 3
MHRGRFERFYQTENPQPRSWKPMATPNQTGVRLTDRMVLVAIGLGAVYWVIETLLFVFMSYELNFFDRLFGPDLSGLCTRIIVLCLFLIFGSHVQYTYNQRRKAEAELERLRQANLELKQQLEEQPSV